MDGLYKLDLSISKSNLADKRIAEPESNIVVAVPFATRQLLALLFQLQPRFTQLDPLYYLYPIMLQILLTK